MNIKYCEECGSELLRVYEEEFPLSWPKFCEHTGNKIKRYSLQCPLYRTSHKSFFSWAHDKWFTQNKHTSRCKITMFEIIPEPARNADKQQ